MSRYFITGSSGFIGTHLARRLKEEGLTVALFRDLMPSRWIEESLSKCVKVTGDVRNQRTMERILTQYEIDTVFHLAALAEVGKAQKVPVSCYETNVMGTVKVLEACRKQDIENVIYLSTDKIFGNVMEADVNEPVKPFGPYSTSKSCGDLIARDYGDTYGLNIAVLRGVNAYGYDPYSNRLIPNVIKKCMRGERPLIFKGQNEILRMFVYVEDLANALVSVAGKRGVFNLAGDLKSVADVVSEIAEHFDIKSKINEKERFSRGKEITAQSLKQNFEFEREWPFAKGVEKTIDLFREYGF